MTRQAGSGEGEPGAAAVAAPGVGGRPGPPSPPLPPPNTGSGHASTVATATARPPGLNPGSVAGAAGRQAGPKHQEQQGRRDERPQADERLRRDVAHDDRAEDGITRQGDNHPHHTA